MRTIITLLSFSIALVLLSCQEDTNTIVIIEDTLDWCFESRLLFPIGTEWTYSYESNERAKYNPTVIKHASKCVSNTQKTWMIVERIESQSGWRIGSEWEYSLKDSTIIRRYKGSQNNYMNEYFRLDGEIGKPETLKVYADHVTISTEKLAFYPTFELNGIAYPNVYNLKWEWNYIDPNDSLNTEWRRSFIWLSPGIGIIKDESQQYWGPGWGGFIYVATEELLSYKLPGGTK